MSFYTDIVRPLLFRCNPDIVHELAVLSGGVAGRLPSVRRLLTALFAYSDPRLAVTAFGLPFTNPLGLAGGFDKNADLIRTMPAVGFGFTEVGSVTARPYAGNPRPWNIRLPEERSVLVHYGLKNQGAAVIAAKIAATPRSSPLIVNIAKTNNAAISGSQTVADYVQSFRLMAPLADIVNLNISCPNSGDGTLMCEDPALLAELLAALHAEQPSVPVVLKIKPDITRVHLDQILALAARYDWLRGFIVSNLTHDRSGLSPASRAKIAGRPGGLSGLPTQKRSNDLLRTIYRAAGHRFTLIGLGGVFGAEDAYEKIKCGATLVQMVTGLIFGGPAAPGQINRGLVQLLQRDGHATIGAAVGTGVV